MALTPLPTSGAKLRASVLEGLITEVRPVCATKAGDTSRTSTETRTADPDLSVTLSPGTWEIRALLIVTSAANAAGDFEFEWQFPADATVSAGNVGLPNTLAAGVAAPDVSAPATSNDATTPTGSYVFGASTTPTSISAWVRVSIVTLGAVTIAWAQDSSNANATTLEAGSELVARRTS